MTFAGHQTFHPRFGWLKKGYSAVQGDPFVFSQPNATLLLGVGKNMVEAIRYWGQTFKVLEMDRSASGGGKIAFRTTKFGDTFLGDKGYDPYLEDPLTLWLMHWKMLQARCNSPVAWLFFNDFAAVEFTQRALEEFVSSSVASQSNLRKLPSPSSIQKDVDVLIRTYAQKPLFGRQTIEDSLDSPFRDLGLMSPSEVEKNGFRLIHGPKPGLPPEALAVAALDYTQKVVSGSRTISMSRLVNDESSPGRVFKVTAANLMDSLMNVEGVSIANSAGVQQLFLNLDPAIVKARVLDRYFGRV